MPTVEKTFSFASDAEGIADSGNSSSIGFSYDGSDGDPSGSVKFTYSTTGLVNEFEYALRASTGQTWETWGVPGGATVSSIQITSAKRKATTTIYTTTCSVVIEVVDSGATSVHSDGVLLTYSPAIPATETSWSTISAGSSRAVNVGKQASNTDVRLRLKITVNTDEFNAPNDTIRFDQIVLAITYTESGQTASPTVLTLNLSVEPGIPSVIPDVLTLSFSVPSVSATHQQTTYQTPLNMLLGFPSPTMTRSNTASVAVLNLIMSLAPDIGVAITNSTGTITVTPEPLEI